MTDPTPEPDAPEGNHQRFDFVFEASATVRKADGSIREEGGTE